MPSDPILTANVYCAGRLDEVITQAVAPFWRQWRDGGAAAGDSSGSGWIWLMRYGRCGEHLKIRIHAPEVEGPRLRQAFERAVNTYLSTLDGASEEDRRSRQDAPPIDAEDDSASDYPDRSLLWTHYGRSHVALGGGPFLHDDRYHSRFTTCLARGCAVVLAALEADAQGRISHSRRQNTLIKLLLSGLSGLGFHGETRVAFLAYHRDWLIRFAVRRSRAGEEKAQQLLRRFDTQMERMGDPAGAIQRLGESLGVSAEAALFAAWGDSLGDLLGYIADFRDRPEYQIDPFAKDPVYTPIFKVFHGVANQLGLNMLDESFTHHLLLVSAAAAPPGARHELAFTPPE